MRISAGIRVLRRSLRRHGVYGTLRLIAARLGPARRRVVRAERAFDALYNVDTAGLVSLAELEIPESRRHYGRGYQASDPEQFRTLVRSLGIDYRDFVFVDLGSGKGRALLLASEFPFKHILGVEISAQLSAIARRNVERYTNPAQRCTSIEVVTGDATEVELPNEALVVYLYTPFEGRLMSQAMMNVRRSLERDPRPAYVVYTGDATVMEAIVEAGFRRAAPRPPPDAMGGNAYDVFAWPSDERDRGAHLELEARRFGGQRGRAR